MTLRSFGNLALNWEESLIKWEGDQGLIIFCATFNSKKFDVPYYWFTLDKEEGVKSSVLSSFSNLIYPGKLSSSAAIKLS